MVAIAGLLTPCLPVSIRPANLRAKLPAEAVKSYQFDVVCKLMDKEAVALAGTVTFCTPVPNTGLFGVTVMVLATLP